MSDADPGRRRARRDQNISPQGGAGSMITTDHSPATDRVGGSPGPGAPLRERGAYRGRQGLRKHHPLVPSRLVDNPTIYDPPRCPPSHPPRVAPPVAPTSDRVSSTRGHRGQEPETDDDRGQDSAARPNRREPAASSDVTAGSATSATCQEPTRSTTSSPSPREAPTPTTTSHRSTLGRATSARQRPSALEVAHELGAERGVG